MLLYFCCCCFVFFVFFRLFVFFVFVFVFFCFCFSKFSQLLFCYCPSVVPCLHSVHYVDVKNILFYELYYLISSNYYFQLLGSVHLFKLHEPFILLQKECKLDK